QGQGKKGEDGGGTHLCDLQLISFVFYIISRADASSGGRQQQGCIRFMSHRQKRRVCKGVIARRSCCWGSTVGSILRRAEKNHAIPQNLGRLSSRHAVDAARPVCVAGAARAEGSHALCRGGSRWAAMGRQERRQFRPPLRRRPRWCQ